MSPGLRVQMALKREGHHTPLEARKCKKTYAPLESPKKDSTLLILILAQ